MKLRSTTLRRLGAAALLAGGLSLLAPAAAVAQDEALDLQTATPDEGFELAVELARRAVVTTQPDRDVLGELRAVYARDPAALIETSQVIGVYFQTIAAANDYWRE
jgi:hypothetical protein